MSEHSARPEEILRARFGHDAFRQYQHDVVSHVLGGKDGLFVAPTGSGKSVCFQVPALAFDGLTVVLSPLIALMQDQVDALDRRGIPATFINSTLDRAEREERQQGIRDGKYKLLYVTPERFKKREFLDAIDSVQVSLLAVDEAHCISSWGHDFRPDYGRVGEIRERLGSPPTLALTATATPETQEDILSVLGIEGAPVFHAGIERPNLFLSVKEVVDADERFEHILSVIDNPGGPGIIYMALIRQLLDLEERLRRAGRDVLIYHGELSPSEKRRQQRIFLESEDAIVLATNAFGMGIDKPDIRFIVHAQMPGSLESYCQEIGRAGRDGAPSLCEVLYLSEDLAIQQQFIEWANPSEDFIRSLFEVLRQRGDGAALLEREEISKAMSRNKRFDGRIETALNLMRAEGIVSGMLGEGNLTVLRELDPGEETRIVETGKRSRDLSRLLDFVEYAREPDCRRIRLLDYFGMEPLPGKCGQCDLCRDVVQAKEEVKAVVRRGPPDGEEELSGALIRGDWIVIRREPLRVLRVDDRNGRLTAKVESATSLETREINLSRVHWRRL